MNIVIIVEGKTEKAFMPYLRKFLETRLGGKMPRLGANVYDGRIPKEAKLKKRVDNLLMGKTDHVIALTDVYTGTKDFTDAADAKSKMRKWVGKNEFFHPHAAQHDFEAWLLPYWTTIQKLAGHNKKSPTGQPETVNHGNPPAHCIKEIFELGKCRKSYVKTRDAGRILKDNELMESVKKCPELKAFVNTIISLCGGDIIE